MSVQLEEFPEIEPDRRLTPASRAERRHVESVKRRLLFAIMVPPLALAVLIAAVTRPDRAANAPSPASIAASGRPVTYLVMTVRSDDLSKQADTLTLFSLGGRSRPYALMIPPSALTEIPGYGFDSVSKSLAFGRIPLADVTVENMLGVSIDHIEVIDDAAVARIVDRIGGIQVRVPGELLQPDGTGRLVPVFGAGEQKLSGRRAVSYLTFLGQDETELSRLARVQQVWEGMFARYAKEKASALAKVISEAGAGLDGDEGAGRFARFLAGFASVGSSGRSFDVVPVTPVGTGGEQGAFRVDVSDLEALVGKYLAESAPGIGPRPRLQLLNGNGTPEAGIAAAQRLVPAGFWLVDSGNARSFDFAESKIIVYVNDEATMAAANQARRLLGVGQVELSRSPNTSIDVTVVIGKDFPAA